MDFSHSDLEFSDSDLFLHEGAAAAVLLGTVTAKKKKGGVEGGSVCT